MHDLVAHVIVGLIGGGLGLLLARARDGTRIALSLLVVTTTIAREPFDLAFETDALGVAVLGVVLAMRHPSLLRSSTSYPFVVVTAAYVLANVLATLANPPLAVMALRQCVILMFRVGTFYLVVTAIRSIGSGLAVSRLLLWLVAVHAVTSFVGYVLLPIVETPLVRDGLHGVGIVSLSGLFQEPNLLAAFVATVLVASLPLATLERSPVSRRHLAGTAAIAVPTLVFTYTRSAWLATGVGAAAFLGALVVWERPRLMAGARATAVLLALVAASAGLNAGLTSGSATTVTRTPDLTAEVESGDASRPSRGSAASQRLQTIVDPAATYSASHRLEIWTTAVSRWWDRPVLGHGPLSLHMHENRGWLYSSVVQAIHDSGLLGVTSMLAFLTLVAWRTWARYRSSRDDTDRMVCLGFLLAQLVLFLTSQFSSFFWGAYTWVLYGVIVGHVIGPVPSSGLTSPADPGSESRARDEPRSSPARSAAPR